MPLAPDTAHLGTENAFRILEDIETCRARGIDVIRLNLGEPDFDTPEHISDVAIAEIRAGNTHYTDPQGILPLRTAIAEHVAATLGIATDPRRVVVTVGAKPTISYTIQAHVEPGDEVIYPSPGFPIYESWTEYVGATPVPMHLEEERGFTVEPEHLARLMTDRTKLIILNSPSNPTGGVFSEQQLAGIAEAIRERAIPGLRVYSDEVYEDLLFDGEQHSSIASQPGMADLTIIASGHSKAYAMTGWRLGYAVLPTEEEASFFTRLNININSCVAPFIQQAGRAALEDPRSATSIATMVDRFQERRDRVVAGLNRIDGFSCQTPKGAFYAFPNVAGACENLGIFEVRATLAEDAARRSSPSRMLQMFLLYRYGVATIDRNSFGSIGAEGRHYLRLSVAAAMDVLEDGIDRIEQATSDRTGFAEFFETESQLWV